MSDEKDEQRYAPAADVDELLRLYNEWWEANIGLDIPRMVKVFPDTGDEYLMFNLNGHPYFGMREKIALWEWYGERIQIDGPIDGRIMRLEVRGDTAWIACEGFAGRVFQLDGDQWTVDSVTTEYFRATEIYHRDDSSGRPEWRMCHFHASPLPEIEEIRPGFGDSVTTRTLGWVPWEPLPMRDES